MRNRLRAVFLFLLVVISLYQTKTEKNMVFAILLIDRPGTAELRIQVRPEHRAYLGKLADKMAFAGPLTSDDGKTAVGSLLVMDFPSKADVETWLSDEPFTKAGVYEKPVIHAFNNMWEQKVGFPPSV
jgi:uncharacterized protein YciI